MKGLMVLILFLGGLLISSGNRAFEEGRFKEALDAFTAAEKKAGHKTSAELLYNKALAALKAGKFLKAEVAAEKAAVRGGPAFFALRDFLLGNIAFERCMEADQPDTLDAAMTHGETAKRWWQQAAAHRSDWPEARRNVERALLKLEELKKKKRAAENQQQEEKKKIELRIDPGLETDPKDRQHLSKARPLLDELSSDLVRKLFQKLKEKEAEKQKLRRAEQQYKRAEKEKDW